MPLEQLNGYNITSLKILDEQGQWDAKLEPALSPEQLLKLYRAMVFAREGDRRMLSLQRQGRIGTFAPTTGQEAAVCGPTLAMTDKDWFVGAFREFGGHMLRGETFCQFLLYHNGFEEGNVMADPKSRTLPFNVIVGAQTLHAAGLAYALQYKNEKDAGVVCFFGDGATSEGDFHEALNFASVWQAPVVFICQNNHWAISLPAEKQMHSRTIAQKALAYDIPGVLVDGNDALAMYAATREALDRAYAGKGPTLIEAVTYRLLMHTTADDPKKYRADEQVAESWKHEPLTRFRLYLKKKGLWDNAKQTALEAEIKAEIDAQVKLFEQWKPARQDVAFDHVYGTRHAEVEEQRAEFLENLKYRNHEQP